MSNSPTGHDRNCYARELAVENLRDLGIVPTSELGLDDEYERQVSEAWESMLPEVEGGCGCECEGHESLAGADMGRTVYCDGSCRVAA